MTLQEMIEWVKENERYAHHERQHRAERRLQEMLTHLEAVVTIVNEEIDHNLAQASRSRDEQCYTYLGYARDWMELRHKLVGTSPKVEA